MEHSKYDPYQDLSPLFDPDARKQKQGQYGVVHQQTELLEHDSMDDLHSSPRKGVTTRTEAAEFQQIKWPDGPRFLVTSVLFDTFTFLLEGILVLIAAAFLCLAVLACRWSGMPSNSDFAPAMEQAMKLGPTLYPILFAALVGRSLKGIGRYRAERGSRISTLWPLMNNKTMFDAILSQFYLARFSAVASALVLLWALSPLGGQASLRLMYKTNITTTYDQGLRYMDTGVLGEMFASAGLIDQNDILANGQGLPLTIPALYQAALVQSLDYKLGPRDIWGNVKVPRLDRLDKSLADADGWINFTTPAKDVESFSSLLGLPVLNVSDTGILRFSVESVYVTLAAPEQVTFGPLPYYSDGVYQFSGMNVTCPDCKNFDHNEYSDPELKQARRMLLYGQPFPQPNATTLANTTYSGPQLIRFDSGIKSNNPGLTTFFCPVTQHFVETEFSCTFGDCRAIRARLSKTDQRTPNVTSFDLFGTFALDMITRISNAKAMQVSSPSELFLNDSSTTPIRSGVQSSSGKNFAALSQVDPQLLADRASMLLNTALQIFKSPRGFVGDLPLANLSIYGATHIPANGVNATLAWLNHTDPSTAYADLLVNVQEHTDAPFVAADTTATVQQFAEVYRVDYAWAAVLILSASVLVLTGVAGMALGSYVRAPDVFDPLMGLTYNNPHLDVPGHHSTLSATERARLMRMLTVRLGDVQPYLGTGKISLGQTAEVKRLVRGRLYE